MTQAERIGFLLGKLATGGCLTAAEHSECLSLGIKPITEHRKRRSAAALAVKSGCSERTYRSIFG